MALTLQQQRRELADLGKDIGEKVLEDLKKLDPRERGKVVKDLGWRGKVKLADQVSDLAAEKVLKRFAYINGISIRVRSEEQEEGPELYNPQAKDNGIICVDGDFLDGTLNFIEGKGVPACNFAATDISKNPRESLKYSDFKVGVITLFNLHTSKYVGIEDVESCMLIGRNSYRLKGSSLTSLDGPRVTIDPYATDIFARDMSKTEAHEQRRITFELLNGPYKTLQDTVGRRMGTDSSAGAEISGMFYVKPREGDAVPQTTVLWASACQPSENLLAGYVIIHGVPGVGMCDWEGNSFDNKPIPTGIFHELSDVLVYGNNTVRELALDVVSPFANIWKDLNEARLKRVIEEIKTGYTSTLKITSSFN